MLPCFTLDNMSDCSFAYAIHTGQSAVSAHAGSVLRSDCADLFSSEQSTSMLTAPGRGFGMGILAISQTGGCASFASRVLEVLCIGACKKVVWIDTQTNVAVMTDEQAVGDRTNQQCVRQTVSADSLVMRDMKATIPAARTASPKPTTGWPSGHVYFGPETSYDELIHRDSLSTRWPPQPGGFCLGNQHVRLWGPYKENPPSASVSLDASIIVKGRK